MCEEYVNTDELLRQIEEEKHRQDTLLERAYIIAEHSHLVTAYELNRHSKNGGIVKKIKGLFANGKT